MSTKVATCNLCRVPKTDEHVESGFHKFNTRIFGEGKMPISEENYNKYEKPKENNVLTVTNETTSQKEAVSHNVNNWHWEESDYTTFATKRLTKLLKDIDIPFGDGNIAKIDKTTFNGDAYINQRKGRVFCGFEFRIDIEYKATVDDVEITGKAILPDVSADDDDVEITAVKTEGSTDDIRSSLNSVLRKTKLFSQAVNVFKKELKEISLNPAAFDPSSFDYGENEAQPSDSESD